MGCGGHRCGAGAAGGCCWQAVQVGVVICCGGALAWSSGRPRGHRAGTDPAGRAGDAQGGRRGRWAKRKRPGQAARCALLLWPLVCAGGCDLLRRVRPGAGGGRWWSAPRFRCRAAAGAGTVPGATVPAGNVPARHGCRCWCSIRAVFAVCRRGQILHLTAYRPTGNGELGSMPPQ